MLEDIRVTHLLLIYATEPEAGSEERIRKTRLLSFLSFSILLTSSVFPGHKFLNQMLEKVLAVTTMEMMLAKYFL